MKNLYVTILFILLISTPLISNDKIVQFSLSSAVVGLGIVDTMLTWHGVTHHGLYEKNTLFAPFFERGRNIDYFAVLNLQLLASAAIVAICNFAINSDDKVFKIAGYSMLITTVILRSYVCIRNARLNARQH